MLKKENRLLTTYEFNKVRRLGKRVSAQWFHLYYLDIHNYEGPTKVGIVVTNKFSKVAPKRNRVKRVFREVVQKHMEDIKPGFWIVIHPKFESIERNYEEINADFNKILSKVSFAS